MKKIKVLMIGSDNSVKGGITSVIIQLLSYNWSNKNICMRFLPTFIDGNRLKKTTFFLNSYIKFIKMMFTYKPDIIHIHMSHNGSFYRKLLIHKICKIFNKKDILHLHSSEFKEFYNNSNSIKQKIISNFLKEVSIIYVLGQKWNEFITSIEPKAKTVILNNTVELPKLENIERHNEIKILFLGVLVKRKGVKDLLEAVNKLNKDRILEDYSVKFIICGDGDEESELIEYINKNKLDKFVNMVGWISGNSKKKYLEQSDIFVLPSYNEGLPISVLEAISYGLPVISTKVGSIDEAVIDNFNGYLIEPGDVDDLEISLKKLIINKNTRNNFGINSRKLAIDKFSAKQYYEKIAQHYRNLIDK